VIAHFDLPPELAAAGPPEVRGLARDGIRLLVAEGPNVTHTRFADLSRFLNPGDLLVVNTSATRAAAVDGEHARLGPVVVHFSTALDDGSWVIELRSAGSAKSSVLTAAIGDRVLLPDGVTLLLSTPYPNTPASSSAPSPSSSRPPSMSPPLSPSRSPGTKAFTGQRLWQTQPLAGTRVNHLLAVHGRPIRYGYLKGQWPISTYQTVFADPADGEASAEMPSAGRPFSTELVTRLAAKGVVFAPITLHAGVSSQESGEPPMAERFTVPARTASQVNWTRQGGGRVIAVGTTATRALESAARPDGSVEAAGGWTDVVIGPEHPARTVDGLITGMHDPDASHLLLLEAVVGTETLQRAYAAALEGRYLWHEFGDSCLLIR
jgi:S-adenosylmethionine:tRNA ribosyltransferase-isomerase